MQLSMVPMVSMESFIRYSFNIIGSGALSGLMLDVGLLKIIGGGVFPLCSYPYKHKHIYLGIKIYTIVII